MWRQPAHIIALGAGAGLALRRHLGERHGDGPFRALAHDTELDRRNEGLPQRHAVAQHHQQMVTSTHTLGAEPVRDL